MRRRSPSDPPPEGNPRIVALRLLGRRDYTATELTTRLLDRGYLPPDVDTAIAYLIADGTINDRRTAMAHARTASGLKGRGRSRILRELEARGVSRDLARDAVDSLPDDADGDAIRKFLARKRFPAAPSPDERRRAFQQLLRRGFAADAIARVLRSRPEEEEG